MKRNHLKITSLICSFFLLGSIVSCGAPSAKDLAARETGNNPSLWDDEDYKTIAAKGCLAFKDAFDKSLGEDYLDWNTQVGTYTVVKLTTGALDNHEKWGPIAKVVDSLYLNALSRGAGGSGVNVPSDLNIQAFDLCKEIGVDMTS
jgi:hypothetical protein